MSHIVSFTEPEAKALYGVILMLSGGNAEYCFRWDGKDDPTCDMTRAMAKLYKAVNVRVPENLLTLKLLEER